MIALSIGVEELLVGLNNANELNIRPIQNSAGWRERAALEKSFHMTVNHTNNADSHCRTCSSVNCGVRLHRKQSEH
jgi:hypothetical protein